MATTVTSILDNAKSLASGILGNSWRELRRVWELERNDGQDAYQAYGVRPEAAARSEQGIIGNETLDHAFIFVLSNAIARDEDDSEKLTVLGDLYDKADQIFKKFVQVKMNLSGTVLKVDERTIDEPLFANGAVYVRFRFIVKYRQTL